MFRTVFNSKENCKIELSSCELIIAISHMEDRPTTNNNNCRKDLNTAIDSGNRKRKYETDSSCSPSKYPKLGSSNVVPVKPHQSPKKKINVRAKPKEPNKFIYGNYNRYYGYRNPNDFKDVRLKVFEAHQELFFGKEILDIGCNSGIVTMEIAKNMSPKHITGIDIDKGLINKTIKFISKSKKNSTSCGDGFPFNVNFVHGNYVLKDDVLLEIEKPQFDLILCLSVTKWIHLNFGDKALKQAFKRMYAQLKVGGKLILEPQPWDGYKRRKKLTPEIFKNYQAIAFKPNDFANYLLSNEVGFKDVDLLAVPDHCAEGFRRPIQLFSK